MSNADARTVIDLQPLVNELAALLGRAKERPCRPCRGTGTLVLSVGDAEIDMGARCRNCFGTGTITDPDLQAAWELLTWGSEHFRLPWDVGSLPDGMVLGLFEQLIETAKLGELQHYPGQPRRFIRINHRDGGRHTIYYQSAGQLGKAVVEALNG